MKTTQIVTLALYFCLLASFYTSAQVINCENLDFEEGTFDGWTAVGNAELVNSNQTDPYGGFPLALSGYHGVKLGNKVSPVQSSPHHTSVTKTISITNSNRYFVYGFAIVLLGYPHTVTEASYVRLEVTDENGTAIPCTEYTVHAQSSAGNGFFQSAAPPEPNLGTECCYNIFYKPWEVNALDLTPYIGQTLTFNLTSSWCVYDVDWGYAYVDAYCSDNILYEYYNCEDGNIYLSTVEGLSSYNWSGPGIVNGQGTHEIQIDQPGQYTLDIPSSSSSCPPLTIDYDATFDAEPSIPVAEFSLDAMPCLGQSVSFENSSYSDTYISDVAWDFGTGDTSNLVNPTYLFDSVGVYSVTLHIADDYGCGDSVEVQVIVSEPHELELGPDLYMCDDEPITLSPEVYDPNFSLLWSDGSTGNETTITEPQEVIVASAGPCTVYDTLVVHESTAYLGDIPNVLTANYDQINDLLVIDHLELDSFEMAILNRWGEVMFLTDDPNEYWNAHYNGRLVNEGVYFYKIQYKLSCHASEKVKTGHITVIH